MQPACPVREEAEHAPTASAATTPKLPAAVAGRRRGASDGQVLVIFALSVFVLMGLCAVVIDVSWYWANTLRVQRAADAAALAGVVDLPGNLPQGITDAKAAATQDGYTAGGGVVVTPSQDASNARQMDVTISAPVPTFFMRLVGINSITATRTSKAEFILPVPMGSPLNYYGVGDFYVYVNGTPVTSGSSFTSVPTSGKWTSPANAPSTTLFTTAPTTSSKQPQAWSNLGINTANISGTVTGVTLSFNAYVASGSSCTVKAALSWNGGTNWGNQPQTTASLSTTATTYQLGTSGATAWDSSHTWVASDFGTSFEVQLTYQGSSCGTLSLNQLSVTVATTSIQKLPVTDPLGTVLASQGGWGAIITRGGNEQNGDAYAPANNGGDGKNGAFPDGPLETPPVSEAANALYNGSTQNGGGYDYVVNIPASQTGNIRVFDPGFCAMGGNPSGAGDLGAGDHWIALPPNVSTYNPVSTYYTVWNTGGNLGLGMSAWGTAVYTSGSLFQNETGYDPNNGSSPGTGATSGCDAYHDTWWTIPTGTLSAGTYVVQVSTTNPTSSSINASTNSENMFALEVTATGGLPTVYGNGAMAVYNNLQPGNSSQQFYLAKIDRTTGAGKTALIDLFDPGDVPGDATLKVLSPDGGSQNAVSLSYTTNGNCNATVNYNNWTPSDNCSGTNVTQIQTAVGGHSSFNNTWIHISIPLPASYGSGGLWQGGWWQIQYATPGGGNDTTTWQVSISGNPVHLVVP